MPYEALHIANAIVALSDPEKGDVISNLKLQKLLYYVQGFNLAINGKPMFNEDIEAWQYGPVVPEIYYAFKKQLVIEPKEFDFTSLSPNEAELIQEVYDVYGQFSAIKLMNMTHEEPPYKNTEKNGVISHESMIEYFSTLVQDGADGKA